MKTLPIQKLDYQKLLSDLIKIKTSTEEQLQAQVAPILASGYWQMGKRICEEQIFKNESSNQTGPVLNELARALRMEYTLLTRIVKFYKTWPQECPSDKNKNINWSHLKTLMTIKDPQKRNFYLNETQKNLWNKNELSQRVKNDYFETLNSQKDSKELIKKSLNKLHCYAGKVLKVIDGDTLFLEVDLGFFVKINLRVRLRGINCAELNSKIINEQKAAISAKEFVEKKILKCEWIAFQTFKLDLHGRYVADVFYLPGETDKEIIFQKGVFLNQELISEGLAIKC